MPTQCTWQAGCESNGAYPLYSIDGATVIGAFCSEHARLTVQEMGTLLLRSSEGPCICDGSAD